MYRARFFRPNWYNILLHECFPRRVLFAYHQVFLVRTRDQEMESLALFLSNLGRGSLCICRHTLLRQHNLMVHNSSGYWSEIPLCIAIFLATCIMSSVCLDVYKSEKRSNRWRQGGTAPRNSLSKAVFWQSFWFTFAFYITWVPYLALQFMWASGKAYSNYGFILFAGTACTMQGFWNFFVYMRPRTQRANFLAPIRSNLSGATSIFRSIRSSTRARSSARASSIPPVPPSDGRIETATELAGSTKNTAEVP